MTTELCCKMYPHPGSDEAMDKGCCCPVLDNAHGRGYYGTDGHEHGWVVNEPCTLHWAKVTEEQHEWT